MVAHQGVHGRAAAYGRGRRPDRHGGVKVAAGTPDYLGGTAASEDEVIHNCVATNAWAISQIVQTQPAVIYLVGESSYRMFAEAVGAHLTRDPALPHNPPDGAFSLLAATTEADHPCHFEWAGIVDGVGYQQRSRGRCEPPLQLPDQLHSPGPAPKV